MSNLLLDIARAVVAGFETGQRTVTPDPVDEHAEQARSLVEASRVNWAEPQPQTEQFLVAGYTGDEDLVRKELRRFQRMYGRASETIGQQRGTIAKLRTDCDGIRAAHNRVREALGLRSGQSTGWRVAQLLEQARRADLTAKNTDPADTAKVGDDLGMEWVHANFPDCAAKNGIGHSCCRHHGHTGKHVATASGRVRAVWPQPAVSPLDRVTLGGLLMTAWHASSDDMSTTERWRRVADAAVGARQPATTDRELAGTALDEALRHLARSLNGVEPADDDHAERLDTWAHRDAEHLAAEMARHGLVLVQTGGA